MSTARARAAGAGRDRDLSVIYHVQHISCLPQGVNLSWARPASCSRKRAYLEIPKPAKKQGQKLVSILAFLRSPYRGLRFRYRTCGFIAWGLFEPERELPKAVLKWRQKKAVILHRPIAPAMGWQIQVVIRQHKTVWVFCAWSVCSRVARKSASAVAGVRHFFGARVCWVYIVDRSCVRLIAWGLTAARA